MKIGMLWYDNDIKAGLAVKVERAANYYHKKYGIMPTLCFVHPSMLPSASETTPPETQAPETSQEKALKQAGVEIRSTRSVLPNHLWIGVNGKSEAQSTHS